MAMRRASDVRTRCSSGPRCSDADHGRRQQVERDNDVTVGRLQPVADFLRHHQRAELQGRRPRQPDGLQARRGIPGCSAAAGRRDGRAGRRGRPGRGPAGGPGRRAGRRSWACRRACRPADPGSAAPPSPAGPSAAPAGTARSSACHRGRRRARPASSRAIRRARSRRPDSVAMTEPSFRADQAQAAHRDQSRACRRAGRGAMGVRDRSGPCRPWVCEMEFGSLSSLLPAIF